MKIRVIQITGLNCPRRTVYQNGKLQQCPLRQGGEKGMGIENRGEEIQRSFESEFVNV
jgi:hypothetical protein